MATLDLELTFLQRECPCALVDRPQPLARALERLRHPDLAAPVPAHAALVAEAAERLLLGGGVGGRGAGTEVMQVVVADCKERRGEEENGELGE